MATILIALTVSVIGMGVYFSCEWIEKVSKKLKNHEERIRALEETIEGLEVDAWKEQAKQVLRKFVDEVTESLEDKNPHN